MRKIALLLGFLAVVALVPAYAQFTYASLDFPAGTLTTARGINNHGDIVGTYRVVPPRHALLIRAGQYIPLAPNTILGTHYSEAFGINDPGDVVGRFIGDDGFVHGFLLSGGTVTTLDFPGASDTYPFGISESGTIVGYFDSLDEGGNVLAYHGFTLTNGIFTQFDFPGAADTAITGINARGDLVGTWDSGVTSPIAHGFACSGGGCFSFDVPVAGATITQPNGISANGEIVGVYQDSGGVLHGFVAVGASFTTLDFPGATGTIASGVNAAGQISGRYFAGDGSIHGFLAQPGNKSKP